MEFIAIGAFVHAFNKLKVLSEDGKFSYPDTQKRVEYFCGLVSIRDDLRSCLLSSNNNFSCYYVYRACEMHLLQLMNFVIVVAVIVIITLQYAD